VDSTIRAPISPTQRQVLEALKRVGEATADELAEARGISASAVRQHLTTLRSAGHIATRQERGQPGRPADRFRTTELTEEMFVATSSDLSVELLGHIEAEDPELVTRIFDRRLRRRVEEIEHKLVGKTLREKVAGIAELLDTEGYLAEFDERCPGQYGIRLHSCAIWAVASRYGQACSTELEFLRALIPEATIERTTHKAAGAHSCAYEVST
jgi:DeoR family suf operon transcriptional repressor